MGGERYHLTTELGGDSMSLHILLLTLVFKKKKSNQSLEASR